MVVTIRSEDLRRTHLEDLARLLGLEIRWRLSSECKDRKEGMLEVLTGLGTTPPRCERSRVRVRSTAVAPASSVGDEGC